MQKKTDKILEKIVKKNYNNELEEILEKKPFDENTKSNLLSILYKIETAYKDYEKVKQDVETKEEFIEKLLKDIKNNCDTIKLVRPNSEESKIMKDKTFLVEKKIKKIICYPIERKILYCIEKISKQDKIIKDKYFLINKTLSDLINVGNNINTVEPLRDFNGYSWTTISGEIESVTHNLIYQNLRILVGYKLLNNWITNDEYIIDYMELFQNKLEEEYGKENKSILVENLKILSILLDIKYDTKIKKKMLETKEKVEKELEYVKDNKEFIQNVTTKKIEITKQIKKIDETINNKELLQEEYTKRNEKLALEEKIFSIRILAKILEKEREEYIEKIEKLNELLKPKNFVKHKKELKEKYKYLKLVEIKDIPKEIKKTTIKIQKQFLKCYKMKLEKTKTKHELLKIIYEFRYYNLLPFDYEKSIYQEKDLEKEVQELKKEIILKAHDLKLIDKVSKKEDLDYLIIQNIFTLRTISLEELYIKITKEKDKFYLQIFDENAYEEKIELNMQNITKKDLGIKLNKKIKLFQRGRSFNPEN